MKVSIITTCYNREATIRDSIESVLGQDYDDIEYIVVDGASKDSSLSIINEYKNRISTIVSEPDRGMYEAINKGVSRATGDIIGLMHSDDVFHSTTTISDIVNQFNSQNIDILYGNGLFVDESNLDRVVRNWVSGEFDRPKMRRGWLPLHPTVYIRRECFSKMGLYDESYKIAADSEFLLRYMYKSKFKIAYFDRYIVRMRMGGLSTDPKKMKKKWSEDLRLYRTHGFNAYWALGCKIASKVPQFITAKFIWTEDKI
ncbi:MAG: glycosyltransferase family 2 protein [Rikenellaceae bacterium]